MWYHKDTVDNYIKVIKEAISNLEICEIKENLCGECLEEVEIKSAVNNYIKDRMCGECLEVVATYDTKIRYEKERVEIKFDEEKSKKDLEFIREYIIKNILGSTNDN